MRRATLLVWVLVCLAAGCAGPKPEVFAPPPGASVIYRCNFDDGQADGWDGQLVRDRGLPGSRAALKVGGGRMWSSRKIDLPVGEETVLSCYVLTADSPNLIIQCHSATRDENCKSYWYLYPNRDYGRWVHVLLPLTGTLVDCASNFAWTTQPGDRLDDLQFHLVQGSTILLDNIVIYSISPRGKLEQARSELAAAAEGIREFTKQHPGFLGRYYLAGRHDALTAQNQSLTAQTELPWSQAKAHYDQVAAFAAQVRRLQDYWDVAAEALAQRPDFAIGIAHPMARISDRHWMYPFRGDVRGTVELRSAGNEYESFQAVILPFFKDLKGVSVSFSDLHRIGGMGTISAENCSWRTQPYVQPLPCHGYPGYDLIAPKPDPLLPGEPFDLSAERFQPLWITLYTPSGTPPGEYEGTMTVAPASTPPHALKLRLRVWDYDIPLTGQFRCQTHMNMDPAAKFYNRSFDQTWRRQWYEFLLRYRFSPTQQYATTFSPHVDDIEFCKARGCNIWILAGLSGREQVPLEEIHERYQIAKNHGILPYCHVYIGDETSNFALMRRKANAIHANFPGLKVMIGGSRPRQELIGYIDIWDPILSTNPLYGFSPQEIRAAQDRGEEVMWYPAAAPQHPYTNVHIGDPLFAARMLLWLSWKYRITGLEYYCFALWGKNPSISPRWPESPWHCYSFDHTNGDGQLCYPGPGGAPAASLRLENIRDGVEDWEAFFILEGAAEALEQRLAAGDLRKRSRVPMGQGKISLAGLAKRARAALAIDDSFCKDVTHWSLDPAGLKQRRDEVSQLIEAITSALGKAELASHQAEGIAARRDLETRRLEVHRQRALDELAQTTQPATNAATAPPASPTTRPAEEP